jgi:leader peptidase (prepilin peptidase)/N-methyltransferase
LEYQTLIELFAAVFGLLLGSFANVCISRMAEDESVVKPRSHCRECGRMIAWYDNIPVLSFLLLRAKCRYCRAPISWRYPIVEALTGVWFWAAVHWNGAGWDGAKWCLFGFILIELAVMDLETRILPDEFTLGGWLAGLAFAAVAPPHAGIISLVLGLQSPVMAGLAEAGLGSVALALLLWLVGWSYQRLNRLWKREIDPLGEGDPRMLGMMAAFLGLENTILALIVAGVSGSVLGLAWTVWSRKKILSYELPFGLFLGVGGLLVVSADWLGLLRL